MTRPVTVTAEAAEEKGRAAFRSVSGRMSDAMRGTKSFPDLPRNPYRRKEMRDAWTRGWNEMNAAWTDEMWPRDARGFRQSLTGETV